MVTGLAEHTTAAIDRRRRGIQVGRTVIQAIMQQRLGVLVVVGHHVLAIPLRGRRAGTLVKYYIDLVTQVCT